MELERIVEGDSIGIYAYEWDLDSRPAKKINYRRLGRENSVQLHGENQIIAREAVCWSYGRTLGNIAVSDGTLLGSFPGKSGGNAYLNCDIVPAGKMRNGKDRWWCRTHQKHWGVKADIKFALDHNKMCCANYDQPMHYVVSPDCISVDDHAEIGMWCSLPPAISNLIASPPRYPKIHVHVRGVAGGSKIIDKDYDALSLVYKNKSSLFGSSEITKVHVTPPAAFEFVRALVEDRPMGCINCRDCGYPHLDLGDFARRAHKKHLCGNCGRDNTWSSEEIASTPLKPLRDIYPRADDYIDVHRAINLGDYSNLRFQVWASTPAILWTANRPQERGIHVHVYDDQGNYIIDDTFGSVLYEGRNLSRDVLLRRMFENTMS